MLFIIFRLRLSLRCERDVFNFKQVFEGPMDSLRRYRL